MSASILVPIAITDAMLGAGTTVPEPDTAAGEVAWVSGATYALGDRRIRATTHRVYECVQPHTGRTALPEADGKFWLDAGPTNRWAPFDVYVNTGATGTTSMTYVLTPPFFNALRLYGLVGTGIVITLRDSPGGAVIYRYPDSGTARLTEPPTGYWDYYFGRRRALRKLVLNDLPVRPAAELTITITAAAGQPVGVGMIALGDARALFQVREGEVGGTLAGSQAEPTTTAYIKVEPDGTIKLRKGLGATNMRITVALPRSQMGAALATIEEVLDVPVSVLATRAAGFEALNTFGLVTASGTYDSNQRGTLVINVKGIV